MASAKTSDKRNKIRNSNQQSNGDKYRKDKPMPDHEHRFILIAATK
jgi:hypothetical protein